jgi:hypothetical protein
MSRVVEPKLEMNWPVGQEDVNGVHDVAEPATGLNSPVGQVLHVASEDWPVATGEHGIRYEPAEHVVEQA